MGVHINRTIMMGILGSFAIDTGHSRRGPIEISPAATTKAT